MRSYLAITFSEGSHPNTAAGCVSRPLKACRVRPIPPRGRSGPSPLRFRKPRGSGRAARSAPLPLPCDRLSESCGLYKFIFVHCRRALTQRRTKTRLPALPRFRAPRRAGAGLFSSPITPRPVSFSLLDTSAFLPLTFLVGPTASGPNRLPLRTVSLCTRNLFPHLLSAGQLGVAPDGGIASLSPRR